MKILRPAFTIIEILVSVIILLSGCRQPQNEWERNKKKIEAILDLPELEKSEVISFTLYTVHDGILKLSANFYPLDKWPERKAFLEILREGHWMRLSESDVVEPGWSSHFRVSEWDDSRDWEYRVAYADTAYY